jgi:hypothetical protein
MYPQHLPYISAGVNKPESFPANPVRDMQFAFQKVSLIALEPYNSPMVSLDSRLPLAVLLPLLVDAGGPAGGTAGGGAT